MGPQTDRPELDLSRVADRVLLRTRSGTGVAAYKHGDGTWGFVWRPGDVAVTRTVRRAVSFAMRCRACGVTVATCTTAEGDRVSTPCLCDDDCEWRDAAERGVGLFRWPDTDLDSFAARVLEELTRDEPFVLFGMVRGFVKRFWPMMGSGPDAHLWARFYRGAC
jgi:hypothetical protein